MLQDKAKILFDAGTLKKATVQPVDPLMGVTGYYLILSDNKKQAHTVESRRTKAPRAFKSIDAAVSAAQVIGFKEVIVKL